MTGRAISLTILSLLLCSELFGQSKRDSLRGTFIKRYPEHFAVWPVFKRRTLGFDIRSDISGDALSFRPNKSYAAGVGVYLFDVSAELSLSVPINEQNRARYGTSEVSDLSASVSGVNWGIDFFIQRYESFYLSNPIGTVPANKSFPLRPDIVVANIGGTGIYVFNRNKFSIWSPYGVAERQLKSRGSVLLAWTVNSVNLTSDSVLLSPGYQTRLQTKRNFKDVRYSTLSFAPGYSYNLIWRKIYLNATLAVGPAHHWVYYVGSDGVPHYDIAINTFVDARVGLGYNSDRWFGGITSTIQARAVKFEEITLDTQSQSFRMLVGYRFREKGFLKKSWREFFPKSWRKYI